LLKEIPSKLITRCKPFSEEEFMSAILKFNNSLTPRPDKLFWRHIKIIVKNATYLRNLINIADTYIDLGHWLSYFKMLLFIIISKPNKALYDSLKIFRPIVLLNTLGKLIEKVIDKRLQFQSISKYFIHPC